MVAAWKRRAGQRAAIKKRSGPVRVLSAEEIAALKATPPKDIERGAAPEWIPHTEISNWIDIRGRTQTPRSEKERGGDGPRDRSTRGVRKPPGTE